MVKGFRDRKKERKALAEKDLNKKGILKLKMANISQNWLDILTPFSYEYNKRFSGSEISKKTGIPQRSVSRHLSKLVENNILRLEIRGKNKFYYLDLKNQRTEIVLNLVESYKSFKFSLNTKLWKEINQLKSFGTVVLFGSQVKGYSDSYSDIDVVVFSDKTKRLKETLRDLNNVQAHIISFEKFKDLVFHEDVLAKEVLKSHVVFGNSSEFVNLCLRYFKNEK